MCWLPTTNRQNVSFIDMIELICIRKPSRVNQGSRPCSFPRCRTKCSTNYCNWTDKTPCAQKQSYKTLGKKRVENAWHWLFKPIWAIFNSIAIWIYLITFHRLGQLIVQWAETNGYGVLNSLVKHPNWRCCTVSDWISGWIMLKVENLTRSSMDWIWMDLGLKRGSRWCV